MLEKSARGISRLIAVVIVVVIIVAAAGVAYFATISTSHQTILTVATFGGTTLQAFENVVNASGFQQKYNVKVEYYIESTTLGTLAKIQANPSNPPAEIWLGSPQPAVTAINSGVVQALNVSQITAIQNGQVTKNNLLNVNGTPYSIADEREYNSILVNTQKWSPSNITSWKWLWNSALKNQIGVWGVDSWSGFTVYQVAKIWGGNESNVSVAWPELKALAPNIHTIIESQAQADQLLASGEVSVELGPASGVYDFYSTNSSSVHVAAVAPPDAPAFFTTDNIMLVKNNIVPLNIEYAFLNMLFTPTNQEIISCTEGESPVNTQANPASYCPSAGAVLNSVSFPNNSWTPNLQVIAANYNSWSQEWNTQIVPLIGH